MDELRNTLRIGTRILAQQGLLDEDGAISARVPNTNEVLAIAQPRVPDETPMHAAIYRARPDVMAIVHTHQPGILVFGDAERPILPIAGLAANLLFGDFPVYRSPLPIVTPERAQEVARTLGSAAFMHLRNHGLIVVGASIQEVVLNAIWLEHHARMTTWAAPAGSSRGMGRDDATLKASERFGDDARWRYYVSLAVGGA